MISEELLIKNSEETAIKFFSQLILSPHVLSHALPLRDTGGLLPIPKPKCAQLPTGTPSGHRYIQSWGATPQVLVIEDNDRRPTW